MAKDYPSVSAYLEELKKTDGEEFAKEVEQVIEAYRKGEITDWDTVDLGVGFGRNGQHDSLLTEGDKTTEQFDPIQFAS